MYLFLLRVFVFVPVLVVVLVLVLSLSCLVLSCLVLSSASFFKSILLYESPGGNEVDGLPPARHIVILFNIRYLLGDYHRLYHTSKLNGFKYMMSHNACIITNSDVRLSMSTIFASRKIFKLLETN